MKVDIETYCSSCKYYHFEGKLGKNLDKKYDERIQRVFGTNYCGTCDLCNCYVLDNDFCSRGRYDDSHIERRAEEVRKKTEKL